MSHDMPPKKTLTGRSETSNLGISLDFPISSELSVCAASGAIRGRVRRGRRTLEWRRLAMDCMQVTKLNAKISLNS